MPFLVPLLASTLLISWSVPALGAALPAESRQMLLVTTSDWSAYEAKLRRFERDASGEWRPVGDQMDAQVGSNGLAPGIGVVPIKFAGPATKREGDRRAPAGVFRLTSFFGNEAWSRVPRAGSPFRIVTPSLEAVDDPRSRFYNQIVDRTRIAQPDWTSSEKMAEFPEYAAAIVIAHNPTNVPGAGSCIFLHLWRGDRRGSAGCTILREPDLRTVIAWLKLSEQPLLVQLPRDEAIRLGLQP